MDVANNFINVDVFDNIGDLNLAGIFEGFDGFRWDQTPVHPDSSASEVLTTNTGKDEHDQPAQVANPRHIKVSKIMPAGHSKRIGTQCRRRVEILKLRASVEELEEVLKALEQSSANAITWYNQARHELRLRRQAELDRQQLLSKFASYRQVIETIANILEDAIQLDIS